MLEKLTHIELHDYNLASQIVLQPYFDTKLTLCSDGEREQWYHNLLFLAEYNTGIAHCVQHNAIPRFLVESHFGNNLPDFYKPFSEQIACQAGLKLADNFILKDRVLSGSKHWLSNLPLSDFAVVRATDGVEFESYVVIDLTTMPHTIEPAMNPIGLNVARPSTLTVNNLELPEKYIWDRQSYITKSNSSFFAKSQIDYSFITNYLGCIIALYKNVCDYVQDKNIDVGFELNKIKVTISSLKMIWEDNLHTTHIRDFPNDKFWHKRSTQYTQSKNTMVALISLILGIGDSRWLDVSTASTQKFRDALIFSSHMGPLYRNLEAKHFVNF